MKLHFTKMHALGNDFIIIDDRKGQLRNLSDISKKLCHRRFGIGADQLLLICNSKVADFKMRIFNPDGGEAEMCGNGIRCLGKYIWDKREKGQGTRDKKVQSKNLAIETLAGIIHLQKVGEEIKVDMGEPIFEAEKIPIRISCKLQVPSSKLTDINKSSIVNCQSPIIKNYPLKIKDRTFKITCVSMGNPHAVIVVKDVNSVPLSYYGPLIENHKLFPKRTNVEFIQRLNATNIKMRVWERGAGETMACGTGASASGVTAFLLGLTKRKVRVHLPGGSLLIEWSSKDNHVYMTGTATRVFEGIIQ